VPKQRVTDLIVVLEEPRDHTLEQAAGLEAAHLPIIGATQVLDQLARSGQRHRDADACSAAEETLSAGQAARVCPLSVWRYR